MDNNEFDVFMKTKLFNIIESLCNNDDELTINHVLNLNDDIKKIVCNQTISFKILDTLSIDDLKFMSLYINNQMKLFSKVNSIYFRNIYNQLIFKFLSLMLDSCSSSLKTAIMENRYERKEN